jgi:hypothetical protein
MSGGRVELGDDMSWGDNGGGELNLSGGDIIVGGNLAFGSLRGSALITLNMTGGSISVAGAWECPSNKDRAGAVTVNLDAGVIECSEFVHGSMIEGQPSYTDDWLLDIEQGMLKIAGDVKAEIDANVAAGQITAYGGEGTVLVQLTDGNTVVTAFPADPNTATNPYPPNRSRLIDPNVVCSWTPGIQATSHDVYFGTDFNDVNQGTGGTFIGNQGPNTFDPCGVGDLNELTTYYWRIDEKNGGTFKGRVWRFTTGGPLVDPNMLVWYKFDERSPNTIAHDSSGYGNDGPIGLDDEKEIQEPTWDPNGYDGGSLIFNDDMVVQPPGILLSNIGRRITFSVWLKDISSGGENWVFDAGGGQGAPRHLSAAVPDSNGNVYWRAGNDSNDVCVWTGTNPAEWIGFWRYFVFVKDEDAGEMKIYYDGMLVAEKTGVSVGTLADIQDRALKIGTAAWTNFDYEGAMDEFRLYDRALSATEVESLFRGGDLGLPWSPDPIDGAIDVPRDVVLEWLEGNWAGSHDAYLGTDWDDVNDANTATAGIYRGNYEAPEYDPPGNLELNTTYYWRVNEANDPCLWEGPIWQFTVANFIVVDNFESYDNATNKVFNTWEDGNVNFTGSFIGLGTDPFDPTHAGNQSMLYVYDNTIKWDWDHYWSEGGLPFASPQDFTDVGVKVLTLYFYGDPGNDVNDTEELYVALTGSLAEVRYSDDAGRDMNDLKRNEWAEWNIEVADFIGVDPCAVTGLLIGLGDRDNTDMVGGEGTVYFDDIRLYPPRCIPQFGPLADFSDDCLVDWTDVARVGQDWLRTDANLSVSQPNPGPVGYWELDGDANDSSGNNHHGAAEGSYSWIAGHVGSGAIEFGASGGKVLVPDAPQLRPADQITVAVWVNYSAPQDYSARVVVKGTDAGDHENFAMQVTQDDDFSWFVRDSNTTRHSADGSQKLGHNEWVHLAGLYDGNEVECYINGQLSNSETIGPITLLQDPNALSMGDAVDVDRAFVGKVDDVQLYNYALTDQEVAWLATEGTGYMALMSQTNLWDSEPAGQKAINLRDMAVVLGSWLEEKLWPQ